MSKDTRDRAIWKKLPMVETKSSNWHCLPSMNHFLCPITCCDSGCCSNSSVVLLVVVLRWSVYNLLSEGGGVQAKMVKVDFKTSIFLENQPPMKQLRRACLTAGGSTLRRRKSLLLPSVLRRFSSRTLIRSLLNSLMDPASSTAAKKASVRVGESSCSTFPVESRIVTANKSYTMATNLLNLSSKGDMTVGGA